MVIVVCGVACEGPVARTVEALRRRGADFVVIEPEMLGAEVSVRWRLERGAIDGVIAVGERVIAVSEIGGVYLRYLGDPASTAEDPRSRRARGTAVALAELFDVLPARVVNRRRPMISNNSKPFQSLLIRAAGFAVPPTLVTNEPATARAFAAVRGPVIYKSTSSVRSIVATLAAEDLERLGAIRGLATHFQAAIRGVEMRVHVVDGATFGARIRSDRADYRYAAAQGGQTTIAPIEVPRPLAERCVALARALEMTFVGIDLIVGEREAVCLEVNPCPGFSYYEDATGAPIADALAAYLDGEAVADP